VNKLSLYVEQQFSKSRPLSGSTGCGGGGSTAIYRGACFPAVNAG
jgi:hypothetical protein